MSSKKQQPNGFLIAETFMLAILPPDATTPPSWYEIEVCATIRPAPPRPLEASQMVHGAIVRPVVINPVYSKSDTSEGNS
jgi:hypothetical protein